jgi:ferrochelatase
MKIESLLEIIDGELLNTPAILRYEQIKTTPKKITRGDLFISQGSEGIDKAIQNGAYGIIYDDSSVKILDEEIAWIKVKNIDFAIIKLLRYKLINSNFSFFYFNDVQFELLKKLSSSKDMIFLEDDVLESFNKIANANANAIFISRDKNLLSRIFPNFSTYKNISEKIYTISSKVFEFSFKFKGNFYKNIKISAVFKDELENILNFLTHYKIGYNMENLDHISSFNPCFVDQKLNPKEYGQSNRVLVFENNKDFLKKECKFLEQSAKWAKRVFFFPKTLKSQIICDNALFYEDVSEIVALQRKDFHFALVFADKKEVFETIHKENTKGLKSLF